MPKQIMVTRGCRQVWETVEKIVVRDYTIELDQLDEDATDADAILFLSKGKPDKGTLLTSFELILNKGFDHLPEDVFLLLQEQLYSLKADAPLTTKHSKEGLATLQALSSVAQDLNIAYNGEVGFERALMLSQMIPRIIHAGIERMDYQGELEDMVKSSHKVEEYGNPELFEKLIADYHAKWDDILEGVFIDAGHLLSDTVNTRILDIINFMELMVLDPNKMVLLSKGLPLFDKLHNFTNFLQQVNEKLVKAFGIYNSGISQFSDYVYGIQTLTGRHLQYHIDYGVQEPRIMHQHARVITPNL